MEFILAQFGFILHREIETLRRGLSAGCLGVLLGLACVPVVAAEGGASGVEATASPAQAGGPRHLAWMTVPRAAGRLTAREIGLVINAADPYSVEVGAYYARARGLTPEQVLEVELPLRATLDPDEFRRLAGHIGARFGPGIQALALAWVRPYAVGCNSITGALALGYDAQLCARSCAPSRRSPYFNSPSGRPLRDLRLRPSMLLAAGDATRARALIDRGVRADHSLALRGAPPSHAYFVVSRDAARNARVPLFPPPGRLRRPPVEVHVADPQALPGSERVILYLTGQVRVEQLDRVGWLPGALADHLTSFGGQLDQQHAQMSVLEWIDAGATASYGSVSEPCAHPEKFPHPQLLLLHYAQGMTAIEAYWKSVAWPQQGLFVGEPLAAPFARGPSANLSSGSPLP